MDLSDEVRSRYAEFYGNVSVALRELKWVRPENIHITLRFLGDTVEEQVETLRREVGLLTRTVSTFPVSLGEPGCFGPRREPRVLWFALDEGATQLASLAAEMERTVRGEGFPAEKRPWRAHLTVARNRKRVPCHAWEGYLQDAGLVGLSFMAREVTLFSSTLGARGPIYEVLWKTSLSGNRD